MLGVRTHGISSHPAGGMAGVDVIVVGAGVAGLTASYILQGLGLTVQMLEASDAVGGRILPHETGEPWVRALQPSASIKRVPAHGACVAWLAKIKAREALTRANGSSEAVAPQMRRGLARCRVLSNLVRKAYTGRTRC